MRLVRATHDMHDDVVKIARTTRWTRDFTSHMFSTPAHYARGEVLAAVHERTVADVDEVVREEVAVVGFASVRHLVRRDETSLYFLGVAPELRSRGIGEVLLRYVGETSPRSLVTLNVARDNPRARSFYERMGFWEVEREDARYWRMAARSDDLVERRKA